MNAPDIRSLEVGMLRTFDALMRERSVSRAAARLFLSQPAVSASLARLREVFDDQLFTRAPHGVVPTPRAQALAPQVERALSAIAALLEGDEFEPARSNRIFRVAGSDHASRLLMPELSRRLVAAGSGARIHWLPPGAWSLAERLHAGTLDIGVIARVHVPQDIATRILYEDSYVFATRKDHPLVGQAMTMERFCATPQIFLGYGTSTLDDLVDEAVQRAGHARLAQIAVSSFGQIVHQLTHSDHGAVVGRRVAMAHADALHTHPLPFELPGYSSLLCWSERTDNDAGVRWLREQVVQIMAPPPVASPR